jgi:hypothetical protein
MKTIPNLMDIKTIFKGTSWIRIVAIPDGDAPDHIRRAWVGLELPCLPYLEYPEEGSEHQLISKATVDDRQFTLLAIVPQQWAIMVLMQEDPKTGDWWVGQGYPHGGEVFTFAEGEFDIISGVTKPESF